LLMHHLTVDSEIDLTLLATSKSSRVLYSARNNGDALVMRSPSRLRLSR